MNTPYEYGGKTPMDQYVGKMNENMQLNSMLWNISDFHPNNYDDGSGITIQEYEDWRNLKQTFYILNSLNIPNGSSVGIDCSGLTRIAINSDEEIIMPKLGDGVLGQLRQFKIAEKNEQAYVHKDASLVSKGDWVKASGTHVMIATGNVRKIDGKFEFEVIEAKGTDSGVITSWKEDNGKYTFGHPFRKSDIQIKSWDIKSGGKLTGRERTKKNLNQTNLTPKE